MIAVTMVPARAAGLSPDQAAVLFLFWFFFTLAVCGTAVAVIAAKVAYSFALIPATRIRRRITQARMRTQLLLPYRWRHSFVNLVTRIQRSF